MKDLEVRITMRGLERLMQHAVKQAQPLTPEIMTDILPFLNFKKRKDLVFWGILLIGFFAMLRKSNLVSDSIKSFNGKKQLTMGHISFKPGLAVIKVTWAKNIQCKERMLEIPLFEIPGSPLCPVNILRILKIETANSQTPLFGDHKKPLFTYAQFQNKFRSLLNQAGYRGEAFSSHSMRRGGATWAHRQGVPGNLIQIHGGWKSDAYKQYLTFPIEVRAAVFLKMREGIIKAGL